MNFKYRKKPVEIEAIQWNEELQKALNEESTIALPGWFTDAFASLKIHESSLDPNGLIISSREGQMRCSLGDWIIRGVNGELYNCAPDVFEKTYEKVN